MKEISLPLCPVLANNQAPIEPDLEDIFDILMGGDA